MNESRTYRFGDICVDIGRMSVSRAGKPVELEPKAFDVLRLLIERRERLVTKDELLERVWRDTFVTPNVLTRVVAQLRKALGDDAQEARYIETVTKRGYRFIAQVSVSESAPPSGVEAAQAVPIPPVATRPVSRRSGSTTVALVVTAVLLLAGGATVLRIRRDRDKAPGALIPTRVTVRGGLNAYPAISPDGSMIAFASDRSGSLEIHVVGVARGSQEIELTSDRGQNTQPAWSPDGRWIVYFSLMKGGLWIVPSTGGKPRQVVASGSQPAWSPDGEWIAFSSYQGAMVGQSTIRVVRRDGSGARELTHLGSPAGGHIEPAWSQSGRFIAFIVDNGNTFASAWVVASSGGDPRKLPVTDIVDTLRFAVDDAALLFTGLTGTQPRLYRLPLNPQDARPVGEAKEILALTVGNFAGLSMSKAGTVAYGVATSDANLWALELGADGDGHDPVRLTNDAVRSTNALYSMDGRRIAFTRVGSGYEPTIWVMDADGRHLEPLLTEGGSSNVSWGKRDSMILLFRRWPGQVPTLWSVEPTTRQTSQLPIETDVRSPRLSPDGANVAYWKIDPDGSLNTWIQRVDGTAPRRVTRDREAVNYPAWSPDGRWLAVEVKRGEETQVGVISTDGVPVDVLTDGAGQNWPHSWSPDGESITFAGEREGVWNVWAVSRRTRATRQLTHFTSSSGYVRYPTWSAQGNRIVFERQIPEGSIWTIQAP